MHFASFETKLLDVILQ